MPDKKSESAAPAQPVPPSRYEAIELLVAVRDSRSIYEGADMPILQVRKEPKLAEAERPVLPVPPEIESAKKWIRENCPLKADESDLAWNADAYYSGGKSVAIRFEKLAEYLVKFALASSPAVAPMDDDKEYLNGSEKQKHSSDNIAHNSSAPPPAINFDETLARKLAEKRLQVQYNEDGQYWGISYCNAETQQMIRFNSRMSADQIRAQVRGMLLDFAKAAPAVAGFEPCPSCGHIKARHGEGEFHSGCFLCGCIELYPEVRSEAVAGRTQGDEHLKFEEWAISIGQGAKLARDEKFRLDGYEDRDIDNLWVGWKARAALRESASFHNLSESETKAAKLKLYDLWCQAGSEDFTQWLAEKAIELFAGRD